MHISEKNHYILGRGCGLADMTGNSWRRGEGFGTLRRRGKSSSWRSIKRSCVDLTPRRIRSTRVVNVHGINILGGQYGGRYGGAVETARGESFLSEIFIEA